MAPSHFQIFKFLTLIQRPDAPSSRTDSFILKLNCFTPACSDGQAAPAAGQRRNGIQVTGLKVQVARVIIVFNVFLPYFQIATLSNLQISSRSDAPSSRTDRFITIPSFLTFPHFHIFTFLPILQDPSASSVKQLLLRDLRYLFPMQWRSVFDSWSRI